ncbi:30S ribosomal protein S7 [Dehalococcoidia bacterium]|nr:30S ribosomal protein S7 [Dehalococcoidia bacterium]MCL0090282.1 30S ribosomal protein S7 [Dehalococcoidia bacterium]MCL0093520.1 30S ribosomal protein S7 [Dehalococcoidia bacterium]
MPRRGKVVKRTTPPDTRYHSEKITRLVNRIMLDGKKSKAERIVYTAMDIIKERVNREPLEVFEEALKNTTPLLAVKPRRIGGATYQVPVEVAPARGLFLAMRWLVTTARARKGKPMAERLAAEIMDASRGEGTTVKKRTDTHKMAEANRAFAHYRW